MTTTEKIERLRKEAEAWIKRHGPSGIMGPLPTRSCWHCNPAHEWMKTDMDTPYECWDCGHVYFKGERLTTEGEKHDSETTGGMI